MNPLKTLLAGSLLAVALTGAPAWSADVELPQVRQSGNVTYLSGGVSEEDRVALGPIARDYNLKLVFALRNGEYLSDTDVVVTSGRGQTVLEAKSEGPWFLARLPSGQYTIIATSNGQSQRRTVAVGPRGSRTLDFRWSSPEGNVARVRP